MNHSKGKSPEGGISAVVPSHSTGLRTSRVSSHPLLQQSLAVLLQNSSQQTGIRSFHQRAFKSPDSRTFKKKIIYLVMLGLKLWHTESFIMVHRLSSCGVRAQLLHNIYDLSSLTRIEPAPPAQTIYGLILRSPPVGYNDYTTGSLVSIQCSFCSSEVFLQITKKILT